jgi:3-phenylpropionate/trans-cinnamate dioxygenase ferredoxin reductase subunit
MKHDTSIVVVGGGLAGARACVELRDAGFDGPITLLAAEAHAPYERPPLSKAALLNAKAPHECTLFDAAFFAERSIDLRLCANVVTIERDAHRVRIAYRGCDERSGRNDGNDNGVEGDGAPLDGNRADTIPYTRLLIATGAEPRRLEVPGANLDGVLTLRDIDDARRLAARLEHGQRLAIVGGGFIGLEVAASAIEAGCMVTVIEAGERLLTRAVPREIADRIEQRHRAAGVQFRFNAQVTQVFGSRTVEAIRLADGEQLSCHTVIVGIGAQPRTALAEQAGLTVDNGIVVDERLATSDPDIYAAGDVCSFPHPLFGRRVRLECWKNASDQARVAALNLAGGDCRYRDVPWFWSDQYELSIQIAGLPTIENRVATRNTPDAVLLFHLDGDGVLVGASGIGHGALGRDIRIAQMLIERRACVDPAKLADPSVKLKALLAAVPVQPA